MKILRSSVLNFYYAEPSGGFFIIPNITTVTIMDTTGECIRCMVYLAVWTIIFSIVELTIGFIGAPYQALENTGPMIFTVGVIGDTVFDRDVVVSFSTMDGSTPGG